MTNKVTGWFLKFIYNLPEESNAALDKAELLVIFVLFLIFPFNHKQDLFWQDMSNISDKIHWTLQCPYCNKGFASVSSTYRNL